MTEYEGPAILELFGRQRMAGHLREVEVAGAKMLRVDIPSEPPLTQYVQSSSIYRMTPCTAETMTRALAAMDDTEPVSLFELPRPVERAAIEAPQRKVFGGTVDDRTGEWTCGACNDLIELVDDDADPPFPDDAYKDLANAHHQHCEPF